LADGRGDAREAALIARELMSLSNGYNTENVVKAADRMEVDESLRILRSLTNEEKKYVCGFLAAIVKADNNISDSEIKAWQVVCSLAAFPTMTFAEAVGFWATH
jgi:uncharacterized tellurite resistance protein B-like protein